MPGGRGAGCVRAVLVFEQHLDTRHTVCGCLNVAVHTEKQAPSSAVPLQQQQPQQTRPHYAVKPTHVRRDMPMTYSCHTKPPMPSMYKWICSYSLSARLMLKPRMYLSCNKHQPQHSTAG